MKTIMSLGLFYILSSFAFSHDAQAITWPACPTDQAIYKFKATSVNQLNSIKYEPGAFQWYAKAGNVTVNSVKWYLIAYVRAKTASEATSNANSAINKVLYSPVIKVITTKPDFVCLYSTASDDESFITASTTPLYVFVNL